MTPSQQQRKDRQDEARREQQADGRIHKLEQEVERLQCALYDVMTLLKEEADQEDWTPQAVSIRTTYQGARDICTDNGLNPITAQDTLDDKGDDND